MKDWREVIPHHNPEALFIGSTGDTRYDEAIVGLGCRCGQPVVIVYDYAKLVAAFVKHDGLTEEEATEWADLNVAGAWLGPHTPILMHTFEE